MKHTDFSLHDGRIEYHTEYAERLTKEQKYKLIMAAIGGATLAALVYMIGWAALAVAGGALLLHGMGSLLEKI